MIRSPVFIVGSPRSGTSLLRRLLDSHPHLAVCGETHFFPVIGKLAHRFGDLGVPQNRERLVEGVIASIRFYLPQPIEVASLRERLLSEATTFGRFFETLLAEYARQRGKRRCGEKTAAHALYVADILQLFPDSQIIHIVRDPRDVVTSLRVVPWGSRDVISNVLRWRRHVGAADAHRGRPYYLQIHYEDLVRNPGGVLERICHFLHEPMYTEWAVPVETPRDDPYTWRARSFQPVNASRVGRWKTELSEVQIRLIEWIAGSEMEAFAYPRSGVALLHGWRVARAVAGELATFCLYQTSQLWQRSVAWRLDPDPLQFWPRTVLRHPLFSKRAV